jgi:hypothetical protein
VTLNTIGQRAQFTEDRTHSGYWWLAYEPTNYFPSCQLCNQGTAKKNRFPIAGTRARGPQDALSAERPLLLNPYFDDPRAHQEFLPSAHPKIPGWAVPIDDIGGAID